MIWEDRLEKDMEIHSSILAWRTPWTEEPGRLLFMGSWRVGQDLVTEQTHTHMCVCMCVCVYIYIFIV